MKRASPIRYLQLLPTWAVLGIFFVVPLGIMFVISFAQRKPYGGVAPVDTLWQYLRSGHFLDGYRRAAEPIYGLILWRSLWMAVLTTILCLVVSYPVAYYIALVVKPSRKNLLLALVAVPFW